MSVEQIIKDLETFDDSAIARHGFAEFFRDYDIIVQIWKRQFLYRFTHCTSAIISSSLKDELWSLSWDDLYTNWSAWEKAGKPEGWLWGSCFIEAYPGATYVRNSSRAQGWAERLGKPMHEVLIETSVHNISLIFHDLAVRELTVEDKEWVPDPVKP